MATTRTATGRKTATKTTSARKTTAKRGAPSKSAVSDTTLPKLKQSAETILHVYLGIIGKGIDALQENLESMNKDGGKRRFQDYEKRGVQLRKELTKRFEKLDVAEEFEGAVEEAKEQFNKLQDQIEDVVETARDKFKAA